MNITDMICQTSALLTEIKKCHSLYEYCEDNHIIYRYIIKEIYRMNKVDILLEFLADDLREDCEIKTLKNELLKLYKHLTNEFVAKIRSYNLSVEAVK